MSEPPPTLHCSSGRRPTGVVKGTLTSGVGTLFRNWGHFCTTILEGFGPIFRYLGGFCPVFGHFKASMDHKNRGTHKMPQRATKMSQIVPQVDPNCPKRHQIGIKCPAPVAPIPRSGSPSECVFLHHTDQIHPQIDLSGHFWSPLCSSHRLLALQYAPA